MSTMTVTQEQAYHMRAALAAGYEKRIYNKKARTSYIKLTLDEGSFNLIHYLLKRIEKGELHAEEAATPTYEQPSMLPDESGAPLFSMEVTQ